MKFLTVAEGDTLVLKCPRKNFSKNAYMEWRNPRGHVMFFNNIKGEGKNSVYCMKTIEKYI